MDGILVQDSDWSRKLASALYSLLKKKVLCDLGIVCSTQNDVSNIKSSEVVMVHRCVLSAASETIKRLSVGGQVYNLVKINGINISIQCWNNVLEFVYCGHTTVSANGSHLCDVRMAAHVLQIKELEQAIDVHHTGNPNCVCPNRDPIVNLSSSPNGYEIRSDTWITHLFENMLDLLVKQTLCNMTIITEKADKTSAEILAHLCMLVAASSTIKELVLQGTETYNSVKVDSIAYNTWLYLLEYVYTSRVSIVKSNIPEVWVASQLLQIDGLANAVSPFANQFSGTNATNGSVLLPQLNTVSVPDLTNENSATIAEEETPSFTAIKNPLKATTSLISQRPDPALRDNTMGTTKDMLELKQEHDKDVSSAFTHLDNDPLPVLDNDDNNSMVLSLNSDSCDIQSNSALGNIGIAHSDNMSDNDPSVGEPTLNDDNSVLADIKSEIPTELPSFDNSVNIVSPVTTPAVSSPAADSASVATPSVLLSSTLPGGALQNAQIIPVQTAAGIMQTPSQLGCIGQWLQTMGLDGTTPTMLWLPQGVIPVVATSQASTGNPAPLAVSVLNNAATSPAKSADSANNESRANVQENAPKDVTGDKNNATKNGFLYYCRKCEQLFNHSSHKHNCTGVLPSEAISATGRDNGRLGSTETNKLQCKHCLKIFSRTWTLNVHLRTHTGERPYKCNVCDKAFSDKSNMRQHTLIHTQNKQYRCPNCHQAFAQKRYMKKHFVETCRRKLPDQTALSTPRNIEGVEVSDIISMNNKNDQSPPSNVLMYLERDLDATLSKSRRFKTEIGAKWDTSVMMPGDDLTPGDHDLATEEDGDSDDDVIELETHVQFEVEEPEDPLMCMKCKKHFKTERQKNSHRCFNL